MKWLLNTNNCPICRDDIRKNKSNLNYCDINNNLNNESRIVSIFENHIG